MTEEVAVDMPSDVESNLKPEIAHILSIDVVGYSKLLVNEQVDLLKELNRVVLETACVRAAETSGRLIRLPTGDGMVLLFFESPEQPLRCATEISESLRENPRIRVRMGAHSGPVNVIEDVNGQRNVAGAGINIAQRVFDCGDAGHILVSRRLADDLIEYGHWRPYLTDLGECTVKHGVKLRLANFVSGSSGNSARPEKIGTGVTPAGAGEGQQRARRRWLAGIILAVALLTLGITSLVWLRSRKPLPPSAKSVAVLPFQSLSDERRDSYFADGMQDEILRDLVKIRNLKVISRTSVEKYRETAGRNLKEIASAVKVRYILEGSVQRVDNRIRIQAQLVDTATDAHIWAEHYDRQLADVFAIQTEIAENIASQLQGRITPEEKAAMEILPTQDIPAYAFYVKANEMVDRVIYDANRIEDLWEAEQLLTQATQRDPTFFLAFCRLAFVHDQLYFNSLDHTQARLEQAQAALTKAKQLQPNVGEVHLAAAAHYYFGYLDYDNARKELVVAREKLPNAPYPILLLGYIDRRQGRWDQSTQNIEHALDLDPRNLLFLKQLALSYTNLRRYADVEAILDRAVGLAPDDPNFRIQRAAVELDWHANPKPMHDAIDDILAQDPNQAPIVANQWFVLALCEKDAAALENALRALGESGCQEEGLPYPRSWGEGWAARVIGDESAAQMAFARAKSAVSHIVLQQPDFAGGLSALGMIDAALGNKKEAIDEGRKAVRLLPVSKDAIIGPLLLQNLAVIYAWTEEKDLALEQLQASVSMPSYLSYGQLCLAPYWEPLRSQPRFKSMVARLAP